jgi:hypothetical protein
MKCHNQDTKSIGRIPTGISLDIAAKTLFLGLLVHHTL